jgi:hypothetical protein
MEFIAYINVSALHILLRNPCNHNGGTTTFIVLMSWNVVERKIWKLSPSSSRSLHNNIQKQTLPHDLWFSVYFMWDADRQFLTNQLGVCCLHFWCSTRRMQLILPSSLLFLNYPADGSSKHLQNIRWNYKSTQRHITKKYNLYQILFSFSGPTQYILNN